MIEWKIVQSFPLYDVSSEGEIRNSQTGKILRGGLGSHGYRIASLRKNNRSHTKLYHEIVALAFLGDRPLGFYVNHMDGDKLNNAADNLEWSSPTDNAIHMYKTGLRKTRHVRIVETGQEFDSASDCAAYIYATRGQVSEVLRKAAKTVRGYHLEYVD